MDGAGACLAVAAAAISVGASQEPAVDQSPASQIRVGDERGLMDRLLDLAQGRLRSGGFSVDRQHAQMTLSGAGVPTGVFEVRARWSTASGLPRQPLVFELRPVSNSGGAGESREAYLAAPLLRDTLVAVRRLRKGAPFRCDDVALEARPVRITQGDTLAAPCRDVEEQAVLRDLGAGEPVRVADVGPPLDVVAGSQVLITTAFGGIEVSATGTAGADARVGDRISVRLQHPVRTLAVRVTGRGTAQLLEDDPQ